MIYFSELVETTSVRKRLPPKKPSIGYETTWKANNGSVMPISHKLNNYYGPYPRFMLENARLELLKMLDMREGYAYNRLKMKCGIYADGRRDNNYEGWGDASDHFSSSGSSEYFYEPADIAPKKFASDRSESLLEATVTEDDINVSDSVDSAATQNNSDIGDIVDGTLSNNSYVYVSGNVSVPLNNDSVADTAVQNGDLRKSELNTLNNTIEAKTDANGMKSLDDKLPLSDSSVHGDDIEIIENDSEEKNADKSVILIDDDDIDSENNISDPIVIDDSFTSPGDIDDSKFESNRNESNDPVVIDDNTTDNITTSIVVELSADSDVEFIGDNDLTAARQSLKRKLEELEDEELEEGEIADSDDDPKSPEKSNDLSKEINATLNSSEETTKKQKLASEKPIDGETDIGSLFVIDRNPSDPSDLSEQISKNENTDDKTYKNKSSPNQPNTCDKTNRNEGLNEKSEPQPKLTRDNKKLEKKFKCDFCPTVSKLRERMLDHMKQAMHYSASSVLVNEDGKPEQILQNNGPKYSEAAFKSLIPICPEPSCSKIFKDIFLCVFHYNVAHNKDDSAYGLAELVSEDIIKCDHSFQCQECSQQFHSSASLFKHIKKQMHVTISTRKDTEVYYLCCDCNHTYTSLAKVLRHRSKGKVKDHSSDVRVLHISLTRSKKKLLPFANTSESEMSPIELEIYSLKALKSDADKKQRHQIDAKIRNLQKIIS